MSQVGRVLTVIGVFGLATAVAVEVVKDAYRVEPSDHGLGNGVNTVRLEASTRSVDGFGCTTSINGKSEPQWKIDACRNPKQSALPNMGDQDIMLLGKA